MTGLNLPPDEWKNWAEYFGRLYPTATEGWIERMVRRMLHTLGFCGQTKLMASTDYKARLLELEESLNTLPPDPNNKLMRG